jgi:3-deoxy-D-manno-octulosonic-acid transferase
MMLLYNFGIRVYGLGAILLARFREKPRLWWRGRRDWKARLRQGINQNDGREGEWIWFHCASLGEFEQGRPLIEAFHVRYPQYRILLTFFSPSGYEIRKNYHGADLVCYLPLDTPSNAAEFLDVVQPRLAFFIKYDLWLNYLAALRARAVPTFLVSAILRPESRFFKSSLRKQYAKAFRGFAWIFCQDAATVDLLKSHAGVKNAGVAGDTRFDRAAQLPDKFSPVEGIAEFIRGRRCIVAGSPWPPDEAILLPAIKALRAEDLCWIVAPHEIHADRIDQLITSEPGRMAKYSTRENIGAETDVLWIDNVGMLSRLYHYATLVYIGGGFGSGIHNTQEPAVYGNPVIFGPKYDKFQEAVDMLEAGGAAVVQDSEELIKAMQRWLGDEALLMSTRALNRGYMMGKAGATSIVMDKVSEFNL